MACILLLETATKNCSVGVSVDGQCVALVEEADENYRHGEQLHLFVEECLAQAGKSMSDLQAVAVSQGPGSYTGLRIGVSTAKGYCFALNIPLLAISTLQILAAKAQVVDGKIIPMLDARRMEVYAAVFDPDNQRWEADQALILNENSFDTYLAKEDVFFLGDGAEKFKQLCQSSKAHFLDVLWPSAQEMSSLAEVKFREKQFEDVAYFEPFYLKEFQSKAINSSASST